MNCWWRPPLAALLILALLLDGCAPGPKRQLGTPAVVTTASEPARSPYLNAHLRDGRFIAFNEWSVDSTGTVVTGNGRLLDASRNLVTAGPLSVSIDSVAIFEANSPTAMPPAMRALLIVLVGTAILAGVALIALAIACASNPKCFGSCPTFYVDDGERASLMVEGFSASVAPALEDTDVDALYRARPRGRAFEVTMKNEALETHVVRFVHVLAAPRLPGGRVFAAVDGSYWQTSAPRAPLAAEDAAGSCLEALAGFDGIERTSAVDSTDLARRETLDLEFPAAGGERLGLVVASRQTLLTTYLFYQTLAYMGGSTGRWLASLENGDRAALERSRALGRELGGIEVQLPDAARGWATVYELNETGPLATDVKLVPLPPLPPGAQRIRLRMTRGHFRLDWVALARLDRKVEPQRLEPVAVRRADAPDAEALAALRGPERALVTGPGDVYTLAYALPGPPGRYELFLESRGYYLEWMRQRWVEEEDPSRLAMLPLQPRQALRELAPVFAREQPALEDWFWRSRFAHP